MFPLNATKAYIGLCASFVDRMSTISQRPGECNYLICDKNILSNVKSTCKE
ncbi:hypothetical protein FDG95_gp418 [Pectobacterium phage vB_PcaM_CBB]|uniref:Uncharacterized protein n=1 Tax=Pectobacterium phage vB_PcaM_CBB TaxID=2772511 RepID=A0A1L2CVS6_9CAUD|nr:hypothetical protein FDG95_gp008 [Pectobacterium phage vB_PcaM_CBB]YP_009595101.1 hypothetical protein FDG95_gp418 [Pectobacterium phage vB_PcaM_CBB]AMM43573.1 hypothetical protein CBB_561 [Pectobacterium phage vB_PcaM_CBB]AMM44124.1 hypothetical protein CBB_8 [Pectobacterium phage vB_PcaM_CBB]